MIRTLLIGFVRLYQLTLSRVLFAIFGPVCRFEPSCSQYALECLKIHGAAYGGLLSVKRLCKCHPLHPGGYDPPPPLGKPSLPTPTDQNSSAPGPPSSGSK